MSTENQSDEPRNVDLGPLSADTRERINSEVPEFAGPNTVPLSMLEDLEFNFNIPPIISVNFRIVGLYFGSVPGKPPNKNTTGDVSVLLVGNPTVKDVVDAVQRKANQGNVTGVSGFRYQTKTVSGGRQILDRVEIDYTQSPKPSRGYPAGTYVLQQQLNQDPQRVFQYYIYDVKARSGQSDAVRRKNTDNSFISFDQNPKNNINSGDYVVWRLLTIRTEPENVIQVDEDQFDVPRIPEGTIRTNSRLSFLEMQSGIQDAGNNSPDDDDNG